jgi:hypothetical protein
VLLIIQLFLINLPGFPASFPLASRWFPGDFPLPETVCRFPFAAKVVSESEIEKSKTLFPLLRGLVQDIQNFGVKSQHT